VGRKFALSIHKVLHEATEAIQLAVFDSSVPLFTLQTNTLPQFPVWEASLWDYSSFSQIVSEEEVFSSKTILCCRGRRKTDTYNRSRTVFIQEPRKFSPIDSNDHQTDSKASLNRWLLSLTSRRKLTWMNYRKCCFVRKRMPYNKLLTNFTCSGPYWGILALGRFCTPLCNRPAETRPGGLFCPPWWNFDLPGPCWSFNKPLVNFISPWWTI